MAYLIKKEVGQEIKTKFRYPYLMEKVGISKSYLSLLLNQKKQVPKPVAYAITKVCDKEAEIEDFFEVV